MRRTRLRVNIRLEHHTSQVFLRTLENGIRGLLGVTCAFRILFVNSAHFPQGFYLAIEGTFRLSRREPATRLNITRALRASSLRIALIFPAERYRNLVVEGTCGPCPSTDLQFEDMPELEDADADSDDREDVSD